MTNESNREVSGERWDRPPDITRPDADMVVVGEWIVGNSERQAAAVEAFAAAWNRQSWPRGLLSATLFESTDGATVVLYSQWSSETAYSDWVRTQRQLLATDIDAAVPGIERGPAVGYRLYRSTAAEGLENLGRPWGRAVNFKSWPKDPRVRQLLHLRETNSCHHPRFIRAQRTAPDGGSEAW